MIKKVVVAAMLAASLGSIALPAGAEIIVRVAPPEARMERVPEARSGRVWVAGHWEWRGNRHHWVKGKWIRERHGYVYNQPNWTERDGRWHMSQGNWSRGDRDRDGIPNRADRDRDGDGVPNRVDRMPDNPRRN
jgi:hypothetical protein